MHEMGRRQPSERMKPQKPNATATHRQLFISQNAYHAKQQTGWTRDRLRYEGATSRIKTADAGCVLWGLGSVPAVEGSLQVLPSRSRNTRRGTAVATIEVTNLTMLTRETRHKKGSKGFEVKCLRRHGHVSIPRSPVNGCELPASDIHAAGDAGAHSTPFPCPLQGSNA